MLHHSDVSLFAVIATHPKIGLLHKVKTQLMTKELGLNKRLYVSGIS
jgi:hypothetical protein